MKTKFIQVCGVVFTQVLFASVIFGQATITLTDGSSDLVSSQNCGVRSLYEVARVLNTDDLASLLSVHSPGRFVSIAELDELSRGLHLGLVPVERVSGDELPVPSVAHWGNDHFIAILERNGRNYRTFDPALGNARWLSAEQVNAGISGQFLAPAAQLTEHWRRLSVAEADSIWGSTIIPGYYPYNADDDGDEDCPKDEFKNDEKCPTPEDSDRCRPGNNQPDGAGCSACGTGVDHSGFAMPVWKVSEPLINLFVIDKPMFYTTSMDNLIVFKLTYKQRNSQPVTRTNFFGVGVGWECNWRAYVEPDVTQTNVQILAS